jgi:membrane fusion protein (multidrug efflux system)
VLVPDDAGKLRARVRPVRIESLAGDEAIIQSGLSVGEKVAASGSFKLRDSALVSIIGEHETLALAR